ncbi:hypothetical protein Sa4125_34920 [Aureimonas sp. SA4125]|uniref:hypothetical protein n=1 Tax=Aureimonas sp. SA4125 TaxID=2826993 RepID=UPI001CC74AAE|nr:hypothetical protein [Aureimonas sp. SA4125]BDA85950.1 hypothetical protein Sa4125_34920 [Aureimonas sp. SA4125]
MTSYLIDFVLIAALVFTSWRVGKMVRELRRLRTEESSFHRSLTDADAAINRAAHAVVMLRSEGVATLTALQAAIDDARELAEMLDDSARVAETRLSVANDGRRDDAATTAAPTQENWLTLIESRLASASPANR